MCKLGIYIGKFGEKLHTNLPILALFLRPLFSTKPQMLVLFLCLVSFFLTGKQLLLYLIRGLLSHTTQALRDGKLTDCFLSNYYPSY